MGGLTGAISGIDKLLPLVSTVAPLLGNVLGTPLAGVALSLLAQVFNGHPLDVADLAAKISSDSDAAHKLQSLEALHCETLEKIASQDYLAEVDDRKNARQTAVLYKDFLRHMAYLVTIGFFAALLLMFLPIPFNPNERELLSMLVGMLVSKWQTIIDFFYGSSRKQGGFK